MRAISAPMKLRSGIQQTGCPLSRGRSASVNTTRTLALPESTRNTAMTNPKVAPHDNTEKDRGDWVTGAGPQASYLKTLSEQAHMPEAFAEDLTKEESSERIDALKSSARSP